MYLRNCSLLLTLRNAAAHAMQWLPGAQGQGGSWRQSQSLEPPSSALRKLRELRQDPQGPSCRCPASPTLSPGCICWLSKLDLPASSCLSILQHTRLRAFQCLFLKIFRGLAILAYSHKSLRHKLLGRPSQATSGPTSAFLHTLLSCRSRLSHRIFTAWIPLAL